MYRGTYDGQGYSPLEQINAGNAQDLVPVWTFSTGVNEGHQAPPIVNDGIMYVTTPQAQVIALDAKTGDVIWRYKRELPDDLFQLHPTNRGVALYGDKVYVATVDCFLVALDAKTGKVLWDTAGRGLPEGPLHDARAAGGAGQGHDRRLRRRVRRARLRRRPSTPRPATRPGGPS